MSDREAVAWMYLGIKNDGTTHGPHLVWSPFYMDAMSAEKGALAIPLYAAPQQQAEPVVERVPAGWTQVAGWVCDYCGPGLMCAPCLIAKQQAEPVADADGNASY